jgi:DNA-binding Xre family transcriptional regulator
MGLSYKPLWILLIQKDMTKGQLREKAGLSTRALAKMGKGEDVSTDVLRKICNALDCTLSDIVEIVPDVQTDDSSNE